MKKLILSIVLFISTVQATVYTEKLPKDDFQYLIVATHNLDGQIQAVQTATGAKVGGVENVAKYLKILRKTFGEKLLLVHVGSLFNQKSTDSEKQIILDKMMALKYDSILASEDDLASSLELLKSYSGKLPLIGSNLLDTNTGKNIFPATKIRKGKHQIQFLGLYSIKHMQEKFLNPYLPGLYVKDGVSRTLELSQDSAQIKIVLGSFNKYCTSSDPSKEIFFWGEGPDCEGRSDIYNFMRKLPKDAVDVIVNANGSVATGYLKNTIISQALSKGQHISALGVSFFDQRNVFDIKKSYGFAPIEVCESIVAEGEFCTAPKKGFFSRIFSMFSSKDESKNGIKFLGQAL